ncbi:hypothetical protein BgiMline_016232, partial [Biomphalaria glabrata]
MLGIPYMETVSLVVYLTVSIKNIAECVPEVLTSQKSHIVSEDNFSSKTVSQILNVK